MRPIRSGGGGSSGARVEWGGTARNEEEEAAKERAGRRVPLSPPRNAVIASAHRVSVARGLGDIRAETFRIPSLDPFSAAHAVLATEHRWRDILFVGRARCWPSWLSDVVYRDSWDQGNFGTEDLWFAFATQLSRPLDTSTRANRRSDRNIPREICRSYGLSALSSLPSFLRGVFVLRRILPR